MEFDVGWMTVTRVGEGDSFSESVLADKLMSVSEEILVFLFRRERVKHLKIGDVRGGGGG